MLGVIGKFVDLRRPDTKVSNIKGHTATVVIRTRKLSETSKVPYASPKSSQYT